MASSRIRNKTRFHKQALVEVKVLQHLRDHDPHGDHGFVKMLSNFYFRGHLCISFELLWRKASWRGDAEQSSAVNTERKKREMQSETLSDHATTT